MIKRTSTTSTSVGACQAAVPPVSNWDVRGSATSRPNGLPGGSMWTQPACATSSDGLVSRAPCWTSFTAEAAHENGEDR